MKKVFMCVLSLVFLFANSSFAAFTAIVKEGESVTAETVDGEQSVYGKAYAVNVVSGGSQNIKDGGESFGTKLIESGTMQIVESGGTAYGSVIGGENIYGQQMVSGGRVYETTIVSGGQDLYSGSEARNTILGSADGILSGNQSAHSNSKIYNTLQYYSSYINVNGGELHDSYLHGYVNIYFGNAFNCTLEGEAPTESESEKLAYMHVYQGDVRNITVLKYGRLTLQSSSIAYNTVIGNLGFERLDHGGRSFNTTINNGGIQSVSYTKAEGTVINEGGTQYVAYEGRADSAVINVGGVQKVGYDKYDFVNPENEAYNARAIRTVINGGVQIIGANISGDPNSSNLADMTTINNDGVQENYGTSRKNTVNNGTIQMYDTGVLGGVNKINKKGVVALHETQVSGETKAAVLNLRGGTVTGLDQTTNGTFAIKVRGSGVVQAIIDENSSSILTFNDIAGRHSVTAVTVDGVRYATYANAYVVAYDNTPLQTAEFQALDKGVNYETYEYAVKQNGREVSIEKNGKHASYIRTLPVASEAVKNTILALSNSLHKRAGEMQWQESNEEGPEERQKYSVWGRGFSKNINMDKEVKFSETLSGIECGIDFQLDVLNEGAVFVGILGQAADADPKFTASTGANSTGEMKAYSIGAYGTYTGKGGWYGDAVVRRFMLKNEIDTRDSLGNSHAKYDLDHNATAVSLEGGRQIAVGEKYFITPRAQVSYMSVDATSDGIGVRKAQVGTTDVMSLSAGVIAGCRAEVFGVNIEPYVKATYLHINDNKTETIISGIRQESDIGGGRGDFGLGVAAKVSDKISLFADGTYQTGSDYEEYAGVAGLKFSFGGNY